MFHYSLSFIDYQASERAWADSGQTLWTYQTASDWDPAECAGVGRDPAASLLRGVQRQLVAKVRPEGV